MRVRRLIKEFPFEETERRNITLDTGIRLHPTENVLTLAGPPYSTASDIQAKTRIWNPGSVKQWLGFESVITHKRVDGSQVTSDGYRLSDGTNEYWWNGASWAVSTASWNTEEEVATNISSFLVADQKLQIVVNLKTTNPEQAPELREVKVLWASDVEFQEDLIYRSLIPDLKANIRPISDYPLKPGAVSSIDLNDHPLETPYNIVDVDSVYNHSTDPKHLIDLLSSYDPGTKIITLTGAFPDGDVALVRLVYEPTVSVMTSSDYGELNKVPALTLSDIDLVDSSQRPGRRSVANKAAGTAVILDEPIQGDLEIFLQGHTDSGVDQNRLADAIKSYFANHPLLISKGLDEEYRLWLIDEYDQQYPAGGSDIHTGRARFRIAGAKFYVRDAVDGYVVKRFRATGDMDVTVE